LVHMVSPPSAALNPRTLAAMLMSSKKPLSQGPRVRTLKDVSEPAALHAGAE